MTDLLPCPFCGEDRASYVNTNSTDDAPNSDDGYVKCNACNSSYGEILPYEEALKAWNVRNYPNKHPVVKKSLTTDSATQNTEKK